MTTTPAAGPQTSAHDQARRRSVVAYVFLTGFVALIYQIVWLRQFANELGAGARATEIVLTAYLGGAAVGARVAARRAGSTPRPWRSLALLEIGLAASALAAPLLLAAAAAAYVWLLGDRPAPADTAAWQHVPMQLAVACSALALPTALAAATLPFATRAAARGGADPGTDASLLLGVAALGACCGALAASFVLVPTLGLNAAAWAAVAISLAMAAGLARHGQAVADSSAPAHAAEPDVPAATSVYRNCIRPWLSSAQRRHGGWRGAFVSQATWILPGIAIAAAAATTVQTTWSRLISHALGGDGRWGALMIATTLGGIAVGALLTAALHASRRHAGDAFTWAQAASAVAALLIYIVLPPRLGSAPGALARAAYGVGIGLPAAVLLGASAAAAARLLAPRAARPGLATGRVVAWAAVGAAAGGVVTGPGLLPVIGFEGTIKIAAAVHLGTALWISTVAVAERRSSIIGASACALLAVVFLVSLSRPSAVVLGDDAPSLGGVRPEEVFYAVGPTATIVAIERAGLIDLRADGRTVATLPASGSPPAQDPQKWLAALPVIARPNAESMLLLGFAGGATLEGAPASVRHIDILEPERQLIAAGTAIGRARGRNPLDDTRVSIVNSDARLALRLTSRRYDAIVSPAPHGPAWRSAHLYSRQFLDEAKSHLTGGGVFVQGMDAAYADAALLRRMAATLAEAFEHVRLYWPSADSLVFLAADTPLEPELQLSRSGAPIINDVMHFSRMGMNGVEDLLAALAADEPGVEALAAQAPVGTDDNQRLASRWPLNTGMTPSALAALLAPQDPLLSGDSWIYSRLAERADFGYVTRRLVQLGRQPRAVAAAEAHPDESTRLLMLGILYAARSEHNQATAAFRAALDRRPDNAQARYLLIEPSIGIIAQGTADPGIMSLAQGLPATAAAVIDGWRNAAAQNWESLAQLDDLLGRAAVTDAWYPDAVRLRADWRSKATRDVERFAFDALRLIDRAVLIEPTLNLYLLRAAIGIAVDDAGVAVESSRRIVRLVRDDIEQARVRDGRISQRELAIMRQNMSAITTNLRGELIADNPRRAEDVRQGANEILRYIDAVTATEEK